MRTRSSSNLIVEYFTILKRRNRRRSKEIVEPELCTIKEIPVATMADTRTMSELLQAPTEGYRDAIVIPAILAENFELKVGLLSLTANLKNDITNFQQRFDETFSEAWDRFKHLLRKCSHHGFLELLQIDTFYNALTQSDQDSLNAAVGGNLLNRTPRVALTIIENKSKVCTSQNKPVVSKVNTTTSSSSPSSDITALTDIVKELVLMNKANQQAFVKAIEETCVTCGGPHAYYVCLATGGNTFDACTATGTYNQGANLRRDLKAITTRSGVAYDGPTIPPSPLPKVVERETEATKDKVQATTLESTAHIQPPIVQVLIPEPDVAPKPDPKPSIPYPSRLNDQKLLEKDNNQMLKFLQIFQRLHFDISFVDALLHMLKFASTFKSLLSNKEKLFKLASTPLNENFLAMLLKKLLEKLGDPDKFLIPCNFSKLKECLALADLGASINLMPFSVRKKLSLPKLTPTRMTLKLANRSVSYPVGVAEDVFVKVGKFKYPADFVVVDYDVDPRIPLILERPFLRTTRALIDVHGEELTLRDNDEAIMFKVSHTSRYSHNYYEESVNRIDVIDISCEEYSQEVLEFSDSLTSGNPTPSDPIIASSSPSFNPFEGSDFILEEIDTFLRTPDELSTLEDDFDSGEILL
uniref:Reverse transcriptase domain-containing protein n=1 Tax=Tanacetum cinerariifolium TaxID=118510 RepID=A0A6L2NKG2_TANCI|nr:reverse transcriptase domain-containing protein [Tanacetum cinerariifolium]